jgi:hypothetical protein
VDTALTHLNSASTPRAAVLAGFSIAREMYHQVPVAIPYWIDDTQAYATGVTIGYAPSTLVNVTNMHLPAGHK